METDTFHIFEKYEKCVKIEKGKLVSTHHGAPLLLHCAVGQRFLDADLLELWSAPLGDGLVADCLVVGVALLATHAAALIGHATTLVHLKAALT